VLDWNQQAKHMALLSSGKVLVWSTGDNARVWDPTSGTFKLTPATFGDLHCAGQSTLADGRIIVVGGQNGSPHDGTAITSLFDPVTETWTRGRDMHDLRWYATSTTLPDGRVLVSSGDAPDGTRSTVPEVYDPPTNTWTQLTGATRDQALYPLMFVLPNGTVYDAGPKTSTAVITTTGTGSLTAGPTAPYSTSGYSESGVMYAPGKILRAGGGDPAVATAMVIDMKQASPSWRMVQSMSFPRRRMNLMILADGSVMAIGGTRRSDDVAQAVLEGEIWNPATETWTVVAAMAEARMYHSSAVLLPDGRVVVGGGEASGRLHAQVYSPPYLFKGARPTIASAPAIAGYGSTFTVGTPDAASIVSVALLRPSASTHAFDMNQRHVPLVFTQQSGALTVSAPAGPGVAPPGDYMLVVTNGSGVPSIARWVRVGTAASVQPGRVAGTVTNLADGQPLSGVTVSSVAGSTTTTASGGYEVDTVPAGELLVTFSLAGFATTSRLASVTGGQTTILDVVMSAPGRIAGRVSDASTGTGLGGVTISYPGGTTSTSGAGDYVIEGLPAGSQFLTFARTTYTSADRTITVAPDATVTLDVSLEPVATWVSGEVVDAVTQTPLTGATVAVDTGQTTATDQMGRYRIDLPPGSYRVTASANGYVAASGDVVITAGAFASRDFALAPQTAGGDVLTLAPAADAHAKSSSPTKNYGTETTIRVRAPSATGADGYRAFIRFDVSGVAGRAVTSAKLRLFATDGGPHGGTVHPITTAWTETGLTWNNSPALQPAIGSIGAVGTNVWVEFTLPIGNITGDGPIAFGIAGATTNSVIYTSREGANTPQLILNIGTGGGPPPAPTAAFTVTPSSGPAPLAVTVTDASTGGPTSWSWNFGDGATATGQNPGTHTYVAAGTYEIELIVSSAAGTSSSTRTVTVDPAGPPTPGMRIKNITFERGLLDATAGFDSLSGAVALETAAPVLGTASARIGNGYLQETFAATDDLYVSFVIRPGALPSGSPRIVMLSNAGVTQANILLSSTGRLRLRVGSTNIGAESPALVAGGTYRIGLRQRRGAGGDAIAEAFVAPLGAGFNGPFARTATGTWTTAADRLRLGATNGTAIDAVADDVLLDGGAMPTAP
jgi:PKD repeat protein